MNSKNTFSKPNRGALNEKAPRNYCRHTAGNERVEKYGENKSLNFSNLSRARGKRFSLKKMTSKAIQHLRCGAGVARAKKKGEVEGRERLTGERENVHVIKTFTHEEKSR